MTKYVLFAHPGACSRVTLSALEEIQADFTVSWVNLHAKAQHNIDYVKLNRKAKVPTLVVDGAPLSENAAILQFLHVSHPEAGLLPAADTPFELAKSASDLAWCTSTLHPTMRQVRGPGKFTQGPTEGVKEDGMIKVAKECDYINERLSKADWWYGDAWSIVDVYLYWVTNSADKSGFSLDAYPAIRAHAERVRARPSFQRGVVRERAAVKELGMSIDPAEL
jgi:glutathione S-transferase